MVSQFEFLLPTHIGYTPASGLNPQADILRRPPRTAPRHERMFRSRRERIFSTAKRSRDCGCHVPIVSGAQELKGSHITEEKPVGEELIIR